MKKEEMSLKFNTKLLDMRARFRRGEVRVGSSPMASQLYYDQMGLEMSRQMLLSREAALTHTKHAKAPPPHSAGAFSFDASVASPLGTAAAPESSSLREPTTNFVAKEGGGDQADVKGAGLGIEVGYTGVEPRSKEFYLDMLSDTTTPLILPDIPETVQARHQRGQSAPFTATATAASKWSRATGGFSRGAGAGAGADTFSPRRGDGHVRVY